MLAPLMSGARAVAGLGWVDASSRRFVLPGASSLGPAPEGALPLELVERDAGPVAIVLGAVVDDAHRRAVRGCLVDVVSDVAFLVASERGSYVVDADADVVACADALEVLRAQTSVEPALVVTNGARAAFLDAATEAPVVVTRDPAQVADRYASARTCGLVRADVDRLMVYNDWLGVVEGDLLLARVLRLACEVALGACAPAGASVSLSRRDVLLVLPGVDASTTTSLADVLVEQMRRERVQLRHPEVRHIPYMTLSAGAVWVDASERTPLERALEETDAAVQCAKLAGRDRVATSRIEG
jgi:GGDEF domain-containing protein